MLVSNEYKNASERADTNPLNKALALSRGVGALSSKPYTYKVPPRPRDSSNSPPVAPPTAS